MGILAWIVALAGASNHQMYEPIFAVAYDTNIVRFEPVPEAIRKTCKLPVGMPWWVYARTKAGNTDYLILSGLRRIEPDGPYDGPIPIEPDFGIVASLDRNSCKRIHIDNGLAPENATHAARARFQLSQPQRELLAQDMLSRYKKAFGDSILLADFPDSILQDDFRPTEIFDAIKRFKSEARTK